MIMAGTKNIFKNGKWKNYIAYVVIIAFLAAMIIINLTKGLGFSDKSTLPRIAFSCILAVSLNLVVGFLGELSLGHAGFMCVGAYLGCYTANILRASTAIPEIFVIVISMLVAGIVAAIFGFIIGLPALRLKGDYLAIATLAFGEIVRCIFKNLSIFGGAMGMSTKLYDGNTLFIVAFVTLLFVVFCCQNFIYSKHGRAVVSIRDNEIAAKAMGINVTFYKLITFMIAAFFAGMAGVLYGSTIGTIRQETFSYNYSIEILVMVVLGGMGSINGSLLAAAIITWLNILLQSQLSGNLAPLKNIVYALILILIVVFSNAPALKSFRESINPKNWKKKAASDNVDMKQNDSASWDRIPTKIHMDEILSADLRTSYANAPVEPDADAVKNSTASSDSSGQELLITKDLGISFGGLKAVQEANIKIKKGQIYGMVGPNGAGKTTIFNLLTGVYVPTTGTFFLDGEELKGKTQEQINHKGIARTFQNIRLFSNMTVIRNVMVGLHNQPQYKCSFLTSMFRLPKHFKVEKAMIEQARDILKVFGLDEDRNSLACNLPYGKQRKLEIARALATNPKLILLDEPAAGMNPQETADLVRIVKYIRDQYDLTVLLIEHDMKFVSTICEELTVLNFGTVLIQGSTEKCLNDPEVIKAYIGG